MGLKLLATCQTAAIAAATIATREPGPRPACVDAAPDRSKRFRVSASRSRPSMAERAAFQDMLIYRCHKHIAITSTVSMTATPMLTRLLRRLEEGFKNADSTSGRRNGTPFLIQPIRSAAAIARPPMPIGALSPDFCSQSIPRPLSLITVPAWDGRCFSQPGSASGKLSGLSSLRISLPEQKPTCEQLKPTFVVLRL
jgi:hypothetical protein